MKKHGIVMNRAFFVAFQQFTLLIRGFVLHSIIRGNYVKRKKRWKQR